MQTPVMDDYDAGRLDAQRKLARVGRDLARFLRAVPLPLGQRRRAERLLRRLAHIANARA